MLDLFVIHIASRYIMRTNEDIS